MQMESKWNTEERQLDFDSVNRHLHFQINTIHSCWFVILLKRKESNGINHETFPSNAFTKNVHSNEKVTESAKSLN